jgi:exodeoxyribonuclease VII small subunit
MTDPFAPSPSGTAPAGPASASPAPASYEAAAERLEEIIRRLDSGEAGLRETLALCHEGKGLVEYCAGELDAVADGLRELDLDALVGRLEGGSAPPGRSDPASTPAATGSGSDPAATDPF